MEFYCQFLFVCKNLLFCYASTDQLLPLDCDFNTINRNCCSYSAITVMYVGVQVFENLHFLSILITHVVNMLYNKQASTGKTFYIS